MAVTRSLTISSLVLRILTLLLLAGSVVVLATNRFKLSDGTKTSFQDVIAYRYVFTTGVIGFAYTLFQIPFATYHVLTEKRLIRNKCVLEFDFYADMIISFLLATGVGAGFAVTFEVKRSLDHLRDLLDALNVPGADEAQTETDKFLDKANISTGLLLLGFLCMAVITVLSSISRTNPSRGFFR